MYGKVNAQNSWINGALLLDHMYIVLPYKLIVHLFSHNNGTKFFHDVQRYYEIFSTRRGKLKRITAFARSFSLTDKNLKYNKK